MIGKLLMARKFNIVKVVDTQAQTMGYFIWKRQKLRHETAENQSRSLLAKTLYVIFAIKSQSFLEKIVLTLVFLGELQKECLFRCPSSGRMIEML